MVIKITDIGSLLADAVDALDAADRSTTAFPADCIRDMEQGSDAAVADMPAVVEVDRPFEAVVDMFDGMEDDMKVVEGCTTVVGADSSDKKGMSSDDVVMWVAENNTKMRSYVQVAEEDMRIAIGSRKDITVVMVAREAVSCKMVVLADVDWDYTTDHGGC